MEKYRIVDESKNHSGTHSSLKPVKLNLLETSKHRQRTTENCALKSENDALQYSQSPRIHNGYNIGYIPRDISYN